MTGSCQGLCEIMKLPERLFFLAVALVGLGLGLWGLQGLRQASVIVEWSTASELDTVGFNILRSESQDGEFVRVNETLIETQGDALSGSKYVFEDKSVTPGRTYYYLLEDVSANGVTHRNGPIQVRAEPGGRIELGLSAILLTLAILGVIWSRRPSSKTEA